MISWILSKFYGNKQPEPVVEPIKSAQRYDIKLLRSDLKTTAFRCRSAKLKLKEAQRTLSLADLKDHRQYEQLKLAISKSRTEYQAAARVMTKLCIFRADLRGRCHLAPFSGSGDYDIDRLRNDYLIKE